MRIDIVNKMQEYIMTPDMVGGFCHSDFSYDVQSLKDYNGPFLWAVWRSGTFLVKCNDEEYIESLLKNETQRYLWVQGCGNLSYIPEMSDAKYIYYPGGDIYLKEVDYDWCVDYLKAKRMAVESNFEMRGGKFPKDLKIKMHFSPGMLGYVKQQLKYAEEHNDTSLINCLHRLRGRRKLSDTHVVYVSRDYYDRCFMFCESSKEREFANGGIIFHGYEDEGYKKNGSVQLTPSEGWSIHT